LIAYGVAMEAFKQAFKDPYVAIAAGICYLCLWLGIGLSPTGWGAGA
jgi:hypothetical protein